MLECAGDLFGQRIEDRVDQVAGVINDVADVQILSASVAGIQHLGQVEQNLNDRLAAGERRMAEVIDRADLLIGLDDLIGQFRQT